MRGARSVLEDWQPLSDRSAERDQERHQQRVREAVQENLRALVVEEALVGTDGGRRIVASIRSLRLARFRYAQESARATAGTGGDGGIGEGAGDGAGEAELETVHDEVARLLSRRWRLPEGLNARAGTVEGPGEREYLRPRGQWACIDRRRSLRNALARGQGAALREEDLRFRQSDEAERPTADCLVIAVRDASGSMGEEKKFLCRSFFHWLAAFIRGQYQSVGMSFICHHTEAQAVGEEEFFRRAESGGTKVSSAYRLAVDVARSAAAQGTNVIALHFTDDDCRAGAMAGVPHLHLGPEGPAQLFAQAEVVPEIVDQGAPSGRVDVALVQHDLLVRVDRGRDHLDDGE